MKPIFAVLFALSACANTGTVTQSDKEGYDMSRAGQYAVEGRYPQGFAQHDCCSYVVRSTTDDRAVISLHENGRFTAHSSVLGFKTHGDSLVHIGGNRYLMGSRNKIHEVRIKIRGGHLDVKEIRQRTVAGHKAKGIIVGGSQDGQSIGVLTRYESTSEKRFRTTKVDGFFDAPKGGVQYDTDVRFDQRATQGVSAEGVHISGGANVRPRVQQIDMVNGGIGPITRMDVSDVPGSDVEAEGYDPKNGGQTMVVSKKDGNVRFEVRDVPVPQP